MKYADGNMDVFLKRIYQAKGRITEPDAGC
jgi:hypothetical protein